MNERIWREHPELGLNPKFVGSAYLDDFELIFDGESKERRGATCNIRESKGQKVWGGLFEITDEDLKILDKYEESYKRTRREVVDQNGRSYIAWIYSRSGQPMGEPSGSYPKDVLAGAVECGLPKEYIESIRP